MVFSLFFMPSRNANLQDLAFRHNVRIHTYVFLQMSCAICTAHALILLHVGSLLLWLYDSGKMHNVHGKARPLKLNQHVVIWGKVIYSACMTSSSRKLSTYRPRSSCNRMFCEILQVLCLVPLNSHNSMSQVTAACCRLNPKTRNQIIHKFNQNDIHVHA